MPAIYLVTLLTLIAQGKSAKEIALDLTAEATDIPPALLPTSHAVDVATWRVRDMRHFTRRQHTQRATRLRTSSERRSAGGRSR